jgi:hypothetical protein
MIQNHMAHLLNTAGIVNGIRVLDMGREINSFLKVFSKSMILKNEKKNFFFIIILSWMH